MLNVRDPRSGAGVDIAVRRGGFVRLHVEVGDQPGPPTVTDLRVLLLGDLVRRVLEEMDECQVFLTLTRVGDGTATMSGSLARDLAELWIPAPAATAGTSRERPDLVVSSRPEASPGREGPLLGVGAVTLAGAATPVLADLVTDGVDPLAVRLALMRHGHQEPVSVTRPQLDDATRTLRRWRNSVAVWAGEVSRPMRRDLVDDAYQALRSDLETPRVLDLLTRLEHEPDTASGAKFETFAHLDRFLSLNLAGSLGSVTPA